MKACADLRTTSIHLAEVQSKKHPRQPFGVPAVKGAMRNVNHLVYITTN